MTPTTAATGNVKYGAFVLRNCIIIGHIWKQVILVIVIISNGMMVNQLELNIQYLLQIGYLEAIALLYIKN